MKCFPTLNKWAYYYVIETMKSKHLKISFRYWKNGKETQAPTTWCLWYNISRNCSVSDIHKIGFYFKYIYKNCRLISYFQPSSRRWSENGFQIAGEVLAVVKNDLWSMARGKLISSVYNMILQIYKMKLSQMKSGQNAGTDIWDRRITKKNMNIQMQINSL